ncbi:hypothetical protein ON010_g2756 [Phytophthora cinnamomi]|nr:hypothetical protein ON010_g2756 [Phytophthora cinnamomi]
MMCILLGQDPTVDKAQQRSAVIEALRWGASDSLEEIAFAKFKANRLQKGLLRNLLVYHSVSSHPIETTSHENSTVYLTRHHFVIGALQRHLQPRHARRIMQQDEGVAKAKEKAILECKADVRCLYPSKRCDNPRIMKSNGQLHNFCQYHRDKANYNQRRLEFKRKGLQNQKQSAIVETPPIHVLGRPLLPKIINNATGGGSGSDFELDEEHIRLIEEVASANVDTSSEKDSDCSAWFWLNWSQLQFGQSKESIIGNEPNVVLLLGSASSDDPTAQVHELPPSPTILTSFPSSQGEVFYPAVICDLELFRTLQEFKTMPQNHDAETKASSRYQEGASCLYPSKSCDYLRVTKSNGQLHKFCQYHRDKANYNQRQHEFKRRAQKEQMKLAAGSPTRNDNRYDEDFELDEVHIRLIAEVAIANIAKGASLNNH